MALQSRETVATFTREITGRINMMERVYPPKIDQEIALAASEVLSKSSVSELRSLRVDETSSELTLSGRVGSFYHKQLAQETIRPIAGGLRVRNSVSVI